MASIYKNTTKFKILKIKIWLYKKTVSKHYDELL